MGSLQELLALAKGQTGYEEKQSLSMLDDFHANAGYGNYTKYARDVNNWGLAGWLISVMGGSIRMRGIP